MALARDERVECLTSLDALRALRPEWDRLWESVRDRTPFQSSAWLLAWWEAFGVDAELYVVTIRDRGDRGDRGDQLIGLAPLYRSAQPRQRARELRLLGAGVSDYLDLLASPGEEARVAEALRRTLDADPEWATCDFDRLRPGSPLLGMSTPDTATSDRTMQEEPCPVVTLPAPLSPHAMKDLRYYRRRADRIGVSFEEATSDTVQEMLSSLFALHGARWASKGSEGVLAAEHVRTFHRAAAPALFERGLLRMHQLRVQKRIGGVYEGLHAADRAFFYLSGFDPTLSSLSPGKLVIATAIERAVEEGASCFDFLGGREPYKYEWNAIDQPRVHRHIGR